MGRGPTKGPGTVQAPQGNPQKHASLTALKVRFQADDDPNENIIIGLERREPAMDFQTAADAGLHGLSDFGVLALAAGAGLGTRCL
jgi:hypothetical protein